MDNGLQNGYLFCEDEMLKRLFDWLDKKRLADWFEKISAAFAVGAVLSETNAIISVALSIMCLAFSQALAKRG